MEDPKEIAARVEKGALRYDQQKPDWWSPENVHLAFLDQANPRTDVVGQNRRNEPGWSGQFEYQHLGLSSIQEAAAEGFYFTVDENGFVSAQQDTVRENELQTNAWKEEILKRRHKR